MKREDIEKAARQFRIDYVKGGGESKNTEQLMIAFAIQQINKALEEAGGHDDGSHRIL